MSEHDRTSQKKQSGEDLAQISFCEERMGIGAQSLADWLRLGSPSSVLITCPDPEARRQLVTTLSNTNVGFKTYVPISNWIDPDLLVGEGSVIFGPGVIMRSVQIGDFALIMPDASIGHDVRIGDFVTIEACACVSGYVEIGNGTVVGAGSVIVNGTVTKPITIGAGVRIAENTVVTKSIRDGARVAGNPGRVVS